MYFWLMVSELLVTGQLASIWVVVGSEGTQLFTYLMVAREQKESEVRVS